MPQTQIIEQTIDDYRADQWLWMVHGRLVQDDGRVWRVHRARIAVGEPLVDITVVDLGPARLVGVEPLEAGRLDSAQCIPPATDWP